MEKFIAYRAYQQMADAYSERVETKPYNAYLERPATLELTGDVHGKKVLDLGCGPGIYHKILRNRGAGRIVSLDASPQMLKNARTRLGDDATLLLHDIRYPLPFPDAAFNIAIAPLVFDYIRNWEPVLDEIRRVLVHKGRFIFSCEHPFNKLRFSETGRYFDTEYLEIEWRGFGGPIDVPTYRRPLSRMTDAILNSGFAIDRFVETLPTEDFRRAAPETFEKLHIMPSFVCFATSRREG